MENLKSYLTDVGRFGVPLIVLLQTISAHSQHILGTWEVRAQKKSGLFSTTDSNEQNEIKALYHFLKNGEVDIQEPCGRYKLFYSLQDSVLQIGESKYKVLSLSNSEIRIEELDEFSLFKKEILLVKSNKVIDPVKEYEVIEENYSNNQFKIRGLKEQGTEIGIWIEWHQNGHISLVRFWNADIPMAEIQFNDKGSVKEQKWMDMNSYQMMSSSSPEKGWNLKYHANGRLSELTLFQSILLMRLELGENGRVISKKWYDTQVKKYRTD